MSGPTRKPCPGMGRLTDEVLSPPRGRMRGRGICPTCLGDVSISADGTIGYHTSDYSEPREETDGSVPTRPEAPHQPDDTSSPQAAGTPPQAQPLPEGRAPGTGPGMSGHERWHLYGPHRIPCYGPDDDAGTTIHGLLAMPEGEQQRRMATELAEFVSLLGARADALQARLDARARDLGRFTQSSLDRTKILEAQLADATNEIARLRELLAAVRAGADLPATGGDTYVGQLPTRTVVEMLGDLGHTAPLPDEPVVSDRPQVEIDPELPDVDEVPVGAAQVGDLLIAVLPGRREVPPGWTAHSCDDQATTLHHLVTGHEPPGGLSVNGPAWVRAYRRRPGGRCEHGRVLGLCAHPDCALPDLEDSYEVPDDFHD